MWTVTRAALRPALRWIEPEMKSLERPNEQMITWVQTIRRFYSILDQLEAAIGGKRTLANTTGKLAWPERGVYFFFETGEHRTTTGQGPRVVWVGSHALARGSQISLWQHLRFHRGNLGGIHPGGGNHRCSALRQRVGKALIRRDHWDVAIAVSWDTDARITREIRQSERGLERAVSQYIGQMPFLWVEINDAPGPQSMRGYIERNSIALLSNYTTPHIPIDPPSPQWLGFWTGMEAVMLSSLWNVDYVADTYDPRFLDVLSTYVRIMGRQK